MNGFHLVTKYLKLRLKRFTAIIHLTGLVIAGILAVIVFSRVVTA